MPSHGIARCRTESHAVASFGGYCEDSGGFCQNRASGGPLDKQVYSLDFLNGSREPCGAKQAPRGGRVGPPAVEMWRSLRDRRAATPVRGQRWGHPVDSPGAAHRLPPPLPTDFLAFPTFPPLAACGRDRRHHFDFFQPLLRGCRPCALRLPIPLHCRTETGGGAGQNGRGNPVGVPQGGRRGGRRPDRGAARPRPLGDRLTPLWGAFGGGGGAARRVGEPPPGVPREASSIERKTLH